MCGEFDVSEIVKLHLKEMKKEKKQRRMEKNFFFFFAITFNNARNINFLSTVN